MSDIAKWALLAAAAVVAIGLIMGLGIADAMNGALFSTAVANIVSVAADGLRFGRGIVNNLVLPAAIPVVTAVLSFVTLKWLVTLTVKVTAWVYHFVFK